LCVPRSRLTSCAAAEWRLTQRRLACAFPSPPHAASVASSRDAGAIIAVRNPSKPPGRFVRALPYRRNVAACPLGISAERDGRLGGRGVGCDGPRARVRSPQPWVSSSLGIALTDCSRPRQPGRPPSSPGARAVGPVLRLSRPISDEHLHDAPVHPAPRLGHRCVRRLASTTHVSEQRTDLLPCS
jgi:hypothetical protein